MTDVVVGAFSDVGLVRRDNQDHFLVERLVDNRGPLQLRLSLDSRQAGDAGLLCAVADGLGGHAGGAEASWIALETLWRDYLDGLNGSRRPAGLGEAVKRSVLAADRAVRQAAGRNPANRDMGTTLVGLVVRGDEICAFNVGDSRLYRLRDGFLKQVSLDHTVAAELERTGKVTHEQAERIDGGYLITNCLGGPAGADTYVDTFPDLTLHGGDRFVICSDGISGALDPGDLESICAQRLEPVAIARTLVDEANRRGGRDNATAVLVEVA